MRSTHDEIALQGIEFWSNVCDEEYELQILQQEVKREKFNIHLFEKRKNTRRFLGSRSKSSS